MIKMEKLKKQINDYMLRSQTVIPYEQDKYTAYQNYLYKRALYGLNSLEKEEVSKMCDKKKRRINSVHYRAQKVLNIAKQKVTITYTNDIFKTFFPKAKFTQDLLQDDYVDTNFKNRLTFKDLLLSKDDIISIFIEQGILPKNFLSLKQQPVSLPSLKNESKA